MRFLVDECSGPALATWLRDQGHDVFSVYEESRGMGDDAVARKAEIENRILVTNDKDFGEKVFRQHWQHRGVILLRLTDERSANKIGVFAKLLLQYNDQLENRYVVVTDDLVRFAKLQ